MALPTTPVNQNCLCIQHARLSYLLLRGCLLYPWGMNLPAQYGPRVKQLRTSAKEVQATLAAALNVSRSHITNIENGKDAASLETLVGIAARYRVSLDWLVHGREKTQETPTFTEQECTLVALYRELPPQARENALKLFQMAANIAGIQEERGGPAEP